MDCCEPPLADPAGESVLTSISARSLFTPATESLDDGAGDSAVTASFWDIARRSLPALLSPSCLGGKFSAVVAQTILNSFFLLELPALGPSHAVLYPLPDTHSLLLDTNVKEEEYQIRPT